MKLFRLRFIVLGLLLCVFHVWCRTCNTEFVDISSSTILAHVILEGKVVSKSSPSNTGGLFNITVKVTNVFKGMGKKANKGKTFTIGEFGPKEDKENCVTSISRGSRKYVFYLHKTRDKSYYRISAFPVVSVKKTARLIRKAVRNSFGKKPILRSVKWKKKFHEGKRISLRCRIQIAKPSPVFTWMKDGIVISNRKGLKIRSNRKSSKLRIARAKASDGGNYTCIASNVVGTTSYNAYFKVLQRPLKSPRPTLPPEVSTISEDLYSPCDKSKKDYCLNGGECQKMKKLNIVRCQCKQSHWGQRCQFRSQPIPGVYPELERVAALEKDRTLTIIGIVIGILIFVCICIASYFLAKRRRDQFLRRQEEKKRKNSKFDSQIYIPPSYRLLSSNDEIDGVVCKAKPGSSSTADSGTQTDETSFMRNLNAMHIFPSAPMRESHSPRNRLSAVSMDGKPIRMQTAENPLRNSAPVSIVHPPSSPAERLDKPSALPTYTAHPMSSPEIIPVLKACDDDDDAPTSPEEVLTPLHISEDTLDRPKSGIYKPKPKGDIPDNSVLPLYSEIFKRETPIDSNSSPEDSSGDEEMIYSPTYSKNTNSNYSDNISWNERGSPEQMTLDNECPENVDYVDRSYSPKKMFEFPVRYSDETGTRLQNVRVDEPSIPV